MKFLASLLVAACATLSFSAHSQTVVNGSFEQGYNGWTSAGWFLQAGNNSYMDVLAAADINGWGTLNTPFTASPDGGSFQVSWYLGADRAMSQSISGFTVGQKYDLTFYQAAANRGGIAGGANYGGSLGAAVSLGNSTQLAPMLTTPDVNMSTAWTKVNMTFTADAATQVLKFVTYANSAVAPEPIFFIDGVQITAAVPEASTVVMMLSGLAGLGLFTRRRGKTSA